MIHDRVVLSPLQSKPMPIYGESIGYNSDQERLSRPQGYPNYHWLQTISGAGSISIEGIYVSLRENSGILLTPHMTHRYQAVTETWQTVYLTFGGRMVPDLLTQIGLKTEAIYCWETESPMNTYIFNLLEKVKREEDVWINHIYQCLSIFIND